MQLISRLGICRKEFDSRCRNEQILDKFFIVKILIHIIQRLDSVSIFSEPLLTLNIGFLSYLNITTGHPDLRGTGVPPKADDIVPLW